MIGLGAAAIRVAAAHGVGASLIPGLPSAAVDGFAAGTLLSGVCFLLVKGARRGARSPQVAPVRERPAASADAGTDPMSESAEILVTAASLARAELARSETARAPAGGTAAVSGHRSSHRQSGSDAATRRLDGKRVPGRHEAPGRGSRPVGKLSTGPAAVTSSQADDAQSAGISALVAPDQPDDLALPRSC